nr:NADH dehydrogenase subunit 3 [Radicipes sp. ANT176]
MEFKGILILLIVSGTLSIIILGASYILGNKQPDMEKVSVYECGFDPFDNPGNPFSVRFFLIGILFLIFDLEISFLFPWAVTYMGLPLFGYWVVMLFLFILTLGLVYEWIEGGLEWES